MCLKSCGVNLKRKTTDQLLLCLRRKYWRYFSGLYNYNCNLYNGGLVAKIGNHSETIIKFHADTRRLVWSNFFMIHVKVHMLIHVGNLKRERRFLQLVCNDITGALRHFSEKESHLPKFLQTNK